MALLQVGMKRGRSQLEQLDQDEAGEPRKKLRLGTPTCQWITVYNAHVPMKQRCGTDLSLLSGQVCAPKRAPRLHESCAVPAQALRSAMLVTA